MDDRSLKHQNQQQSYEPTDGQPVTVAHFTKRQSVFRRFIYKFRVLILVGVLFILLLVVTGSVYALHARKPKVTATTSAPKSISTPKPASTSPTPSPPTTPSPQSTIHTTTPTVVNKPSSIPAATSNGTQTFSVSAGTPLLTDLGSYTAPSSFDVGRCNYQVVFPYSVIGAGSTFLREFSSTTDPNLGPSSGEYAHETYTHSTDTSITGGENMATGYNTHPIVSIYFQIVNEATGQVMTTSPTVQFNCP